MELKKFKGDIMPLPLFGILYDFKSIVNKIAILFGIIIIIYSLLWILAKLNLIPEIIFFIFPQIILLLIGIFIVYIAYNSQKRGY